MAGARKLRVKASNLKATSNLSRTSRGSSSAQLTMRSTPQKFATSSWLCTWSTKRTSLTSPSTTRSTSPLTFATGCSSASSPAPSSPWFPERHQNGHNRPLYMSLRLFIYTYIFNEILSSNLILLLHLFDFVKDFSIKDKNITFWFFG